MGRMTEMWTEICTPVVEERHRRGLGGQSSDGEEEQRWGGRDVLAGAGETVSEKERCLTLCPVTGIFDQVTLTYT